MTRIILTYGLISGLVIILTSLTVIVTFGDQGGGALGYVLGYLVMLVGLSSILVGVKQHRDQALGGVIRFWPAFLLGLGIAVVASLMYVAIWEVYMAATHYTFMDNYEAKMLAAKHAAGVTGADYAKAVAEADQARRQYRDPLYRLPETFVEIFPVGFVIAFVTAVLVRNPKFLSARSRPAAA